MKAIDKLQFVACYLQTAAWVITDTGDNNTFTKESELDAAVECGKFIAMCEAQFGKEKAIELLTVPGNDLTYLAPNCLFLNRNGHGSGFWDREKEFGDVECNILSALAKQMGSHECYHVRGPKSKLTFY